MRRTALTLALILSTAPLSRAAPPQDVAALEAANMVGVLEYCAAQKHATADNVAHARAILTHRPALPPQRDLDQAEQLGKNGTLLAAGEQHTLPDLGRQTKQTTGDMCEGLAMNADILADMLK